MADIFQAATKLGHYAGLNGIRFDRHISKPDHSGPAQTSVFEIKAAIDDPLEIRQSGQHGDREIHVRSVGELNNQSWFTLVVVERLNDSYGEVVTAYNSRKFENTGSQIWARKKEMSQ